MALSKLGTNFDALYQIWLTLKYGCANEQVANTLVDIQKNLVKGAESYEEELKEIRKNVRKFNRTSTSLKLRWRSIRGTDTKYLILDPRH